MTDKTSATYTCFVCLQESTNSKKCSHCGAKIEELDMSASTISPPEYGSVVVRSAGDRIQIRALVSEAIDELTQNYKDFFEVEEQGDALVVKCNSIAGDRFVSVLNDKISKEDVLLPLSFRSYV
jgi:hypothetical protein